MRRSLPIERSSARVGFTVVLMVAFPLDVFHVRFAPQAADALLADRGHDILRKPDTRVAPSECHRVDGILSKRHALLTCHRAAR